MKRLLQPVAVALMGLVAIQPAAAGFFCGAPAAPCPLAITDMGPHCGALSKADLEGSRQTAQVRAIPRTMASVALPATRKALAVAVVDAPVEALPVPAAAAFVDAQTDARAKSPPIYIRNRVFRI
jgi:hypothetical protein